MSSGRLRFNERLQVAGRCDDDPVGWNGRETPVRRSRRKEYNKWYEQRPHRVRPGRWGRRVRGGAQPGTAASGAARSGGRRARRDGLPV
jgi:hypothetical protein